MATKTLKAASRDRVGKGAARALRRAGNIPAVIYGAKQPPLGIVLERNATSLLLHGGGFLTTVFEIEVDGKVERAIPRDYQLDPVKDTLLHVDFLRVDEHAVIAVEIPVHFVGQEKAPGIKAGGVLNVVRHTVELYVAADSIPDFIEANLEGLEVGDSLHISAIKLPQGASPTITDRDFTVATIAAPTVDEEPAAEEAAAS